MNEHKKCVVCGDIIYGVIEREADGYRTWWDVHYCRISEKKVKPKFRYNWAKNKFEKVRK